MQGRFPPHADLGKNTYGGASDFPYHLRVYLSFLFGGRHMATEAIAFALSGLYEAAVTPNAWPDALSSFARATHSVGCRLRPLAPEPALRFPASAELGEFLHDFHSEGWGLADPRTSRGVPLVKSGRAVVLEHDIASDDERGALPSTRRCFGATTCRGGRRSPFPSTEARVSCRS